MAGNVYPNDSGMLSIWDDPGKNIPYVNPPEPVKGFQNWNGGAKVQDLIQSGLGERTDLPESTRATICFE